MDIVKIARGLVAPRRWTTVHFMVRFGVITAILWYFWLVPVAMFLNAPCLRDSGILFDFSFAAAALAYGGFMAAFASLAVADRL